MKICPACSFENPEEFPICCYCNTSIVQVPSHTPLDPGSAEHEKEIIRKSRSKLLNARLRSAIVWYCLALIFVAVIPGMLLDPIALAQLALTGVVVASLVIRGTLGQFTAGFLQGLLSGVVFMTQGIPSPGIAFTLVGHICFGAVLWFWVDALQRQQW